MIAVKIGGVLAGSAKGVSALLDFATHNADQGVVVVTSAVKGATNFLVDATRSVADGLLAPLDAVAGFRELHSGLIRDLGLPGDLLSLEGGLLLDTLVLLANSGRASRADFDMVLRFGEDCAVSIISEYFRANKVPPLPIASDDTLIATNDTFGAAEVIMGKTADNVREKFVSLGGLIPIISGFVGKTLDGKMTTTGRNSSDYTVCIIAGALGCKRVYICKDVDGMMSADPYVVKDARCVPYVSFTEALEISELGGKVVHPKAVRACIDFGMELKLCKLGALEGEGTLVSSRPSGIAGPLAVGCKQGTAIVNISSPSMVGVYGFLEKIFRVFAVHRVPVDAISTSQSSVSVTIDSTGNIAGDAINSLMEDLREICDVTLNEGNATVGVVAGQGAPFGADDIISILGNLKGIVDDVGLISWSKSGASCSFVVESSRAHDVVRCLHKSLF